MMTTIGSIGLDTKSCIKQKIINDKIEDIELKCRSGKISLTAETFIWGMIPTKEESSATNDEI